MENTDSDNLLKLILSQKTPTQIESMFDKLKQIKSVKFNFPLETINDLNESLNKHKLIENIINPNNNSNKIFIYGSNAPIPLKYNNVEIRKSNIHGNGLFATDDIPAGIIITFYPSHALIIDKKIYLSNKIVNKEYFMENMESLSQTHSFYMSVNDNIQIIGNPRDTTNTLLLGHMINDGIGNVFLNIDIDETKNFIKFKNLVVKYFLEGSKNINCKFVKDNNNILISVVTTKNIKKDEELLTLYNPMYWFNINYNMGNTSDNYALNFMHMLSKDEKFVSLINKFL